MEYKNCLDYCDRLNEFLKYELESKDKSENTVIRYGCSANEFLQYIKEKKGLHGLQDAQLKRTTRDDIIDFRTQLLKAGQEHSTINNKSTGIFQFLKFLVEKGVLKENPYKNISKLKVNRRQQEYFTVEEANQFLSVIDNIRDKLLILMYANNGFRKSEPLDLTIQDVETDEIKFIGKGNKERMQVLNEIVQKSMEQWLKEREHILKENHVSTDLLFINENGEKLKDNNVSYIIQKYGKLAGLPKKKCHAHAFRRTYATILLRAGVDLRTLQEALGHKMITTTQLYIDIDKDQLRKANSKINIG